MSIFSKIFSPKTWKVAKTKIIGGFGRSFAWFGSKAKGGWNRVKSIYSKNPQLWNGVLISAGSIALTKAFSSTSQNLLVAEERDKENYGSTGVRLYEDKVNHHVGRLIELLTRLKYARHGSTQFKELLVEVTQCYHDLLHGMSPEDSDVACTTDIIIGALYRSGLKPELSKDHPSIFMAMINAKDDARSVHGVEDDILNMLYFDSFKIPLTVV